MDRRSFLKATTGSAALLAGLPGSVAGADRPGAPSIELAPDARRLRVRVAGEADLPGPAANLARMAGRLATLSGGRFGLISAADGAAADGETFWTSHLVDHHPAFALFAGRPGDAAPRAHDFLTWMVAAGGDALLDDLAEQHGVVARLIGHSGPQPGLWTTIGAAGRDVRAMAVAVDGAAAAALTRIGGQPRAIAPSEAATMLKSGAADAVEVGSALTSLALGLPVGEGMALAPALQPAGRTAALVLSQDVWSTLSAAEQAMITLAAREEVWQSLADETAHAPLLAGLLAEVGTPRLALADAGRVAFETAVAAMWTEIAGTDARSARIAASQHAFFSSSSGPRIA